MRTTRLPRATFLVATSTSLLFILGCTARKFNSNTSKANDTTPASPMRLVDANDVSVLIPLEVTDDFPLSDVIAEANFDAVEIALRNLKTDRYRNSMAFYPLTSKMADWRIMAFRFDPCAPSQAEAEAKRLPCVVQLRIIAQPVVRASDMEIKTWNRPPRKTIDQSMHIVVNIDPKEVKAVTDDVLGIKEKSAAGGAPTTGVAMGLHPGLASKVPGLQDVMRQFLKKWSGGGTKRPSVIALMTGGIPNPWIFHNGTFDAKGKFTLSPLSLVEGTPTSQSFQAQEQDFVTDKARIGKFNVDSIPGHSVEVQSLEKRAIGALFPSATHPGAPNVILDRTLLEGFRAIENPKINHALSLDCVSCHAVGPTTAARVYGFPKLSEELDALRALDSTQRFVTPPGVSAFVHHSLLPLNHDKTATGPWNLRNFGYMKTAPTISLRTANETGEVVAYVNRVIIGAANDGPNKCDQAKEKKVWHCMLTPDGGTAESCMQLCN